MIMPRGSDQLLLPVNPFFIGLTLLVALALNLLPLGRQPAMPDLLAVVLVFWNVHQPRRVGVGLAFLFGLLMDVHEGALLGQHALAYTLLSFVAISIHRRLTVVRPAAAGAADPAAVLGGAPGVAAGAAGWPAACSRAGACCWRRCSRRCCGRWPRCCCWRRSGARPTPTRIDLCDPAMTENCDLERDSTAFAGACWRRRPSCCWASGCWLAAGGAAGAAPRRPGAAGRGQPHRGGAGGAQPRPHRRPQRRRAGHQLLGLHAGDHAVAGRPAGAADRRAGQVVDISRATASASSRLLDESKSFESLPIRTKLTEEEVARFTAQRFRFPGVDVKARLFRNYPLGETGSHLLGYIGRINQAEKKAMEDWSDEDQANYNGTEYIGKLGLEQSYERELHGTTGFEEVETSAGGRAVRRSGQPRRHAGQHAGAVGRHPAAGAGGADVRRPPRRAGGAGPAQRRGAGLRQQAHLRPQPVRRRHRRGQLARAQREHRQAAAQPRAARHLPAGHRPSSPSWRWPRWCPASAGPAPSSTTAAPSSSATTPSAAMATTAWGRWT
jgi:hypothetical protein